jgi:arylsulfatase A-like enzyme
VTDRADLPNIVILYADDLGFGDLGCYGAAAVRTPAIDRLAAEGVLFRQGYAAAATCTPSRYSLLTGAYPWRNPRAAILAGDAPLILAPGTITLPAMLRQAGYRTGVVGKWHLGLGRGDLDWNRPVTATPNDVGFDYAFIMAATNDRVPCVYIENRHVVGLDPGDPIEVTYDARHAFPEVPTGRTRPDLLRMMYSHGHDGTIVNGVSRIGFMRGGREALWRDETMADEFARRAGAFATENRDRPFFLYYAFHQPHVPRLPAPRFHGATGLGPRGDAIAEMDWHVGEFLATLERLGIRERTIVVFTSDNGPVLDDGYADRAEELNGTHRPAGPLRGGKYSLFDGGTRVPLIVNRPGRLRPGVSDALVCQVDFHASLAALTRRRPAAGEAPDSRDLLAALLEGSPDGRGELMVEGVQGKTVLRRGDWVYIHPCEGPAVDPHTRIELGNARVPQLYNLRADIGQRRDMAAANRALTEEMALRRREILNSGWTRPA